MILYKILYYKLKKKYRLYKNRNKDKRNLEIGNGQERIKGFETLNIEFGPLTDYWHDATKKLPFFDNTFEIIYASHVLEHIPWYLTKEILNDWYRVIKKNGWLELWIPDGMKIIKAYIDAENGDNYIENDGWYRFNEKKDNCIWLNGRIFSYGDGTTNIASSNWHHAIFTYKYLSSLLYEIGFKNIKKMELNEVRAYNHGWINLGIKCQK